MNEQSPAVSAPRPETVVRVTVTGSDGRKEFYENGRLVSVVRPPASTGVITW